MKDDSCRPGSLLGVPALWVAVPVMDPLPAIISAARSRILYPFHLFHKLRSLYCLPLPQVVSGAPGARLVDQVVGPRVLVEDDTGRNRLNSNYYITKQVGEGRV